MKTSQEDESLGESRTYITSSTLSENTEYQDQLEGESQDPEQGLDFRSKDHKVENKVQLFGASNSQVEQIFR